MSPLHSVYWCVTYHLKALSKRIQINHKLSVHKAFRFRQLPVTLALSLPLLAFSAVNNNETLPLTLYTNGIVWNTENPSKPHKAFVVKGNRFVAVGDKSLAKRYQDKVQHRVDLKGRFVVPGFIDSHVHFLIGGYRLSQVKLRDAKTKREFIRRITAKSKQLKPGQWIIGGDWDHENWGGELPHRDWLDKAVPNHPVWVTRLDGHMALANSKALELAGIDNSVKNVKGGDIVRDEPGIITGIFKDNAMDYIASAIPDASIEQNKQALLDAMRYVNQQGVTSVVDMADFTSLNTVKQLHNNQQLSVRIYSHVPLDQWQALKQYIEQNGRGDHWHTVGGLKAFVDGSLGSHTAAFFKPYNDQPDDRGMLVIEPDRLLQQVQSADKHNLNLSIHAIGDKAIHTLLDVYQKVINTNGKKDRRFRIEHAQHIAEKDFQRFAELDIVASMQPYHAIDDGRWAEKLIGDRINTTYAFNRLLKQGATVAFGSDWFVAPPKPLMTIYAAVTRRTLDGKNPDGWVAKEKVTVAEAINAHTIHAAYASFSEQDKGSIAAGKLADFVVLSDNLNAIDPKTIKDVEVLKTFVDGVEVYSKY